MTHQIAPIAFPASPGFCRKVRLAAFILLSLSPAALARDAVITRLNQVADFLESKLKDDPQDFIAANRLADTLLRRSRWTGNLDDLRRAATVAEQSGKDLPPDLNPGGVAARAQAALAGHRFAEARDRARELASLQPGKSPPVQLMGDALMELGDLEGAAKAFDQLVELDDPSVGTEARAARLAWLRGQVAQAREHFSKALELARPSGDLETIVWAMIQNGEIAFRCGDFAQAEAHYLEARKLAADHWSALEHLAELRGAQGRDEEAVALFTQAIRQTNRPELWQALGDFHRFQRRETEAKAAYDQALAGYRASLDRGESLYIHHLAGFYSDSMEDAAEAEKWARRDLEGRQSGYAWDTLAWALSKAGDSTGALEAARKALTTGLADPHILQHAAMIHLGAGEVADGQRLLKRCAEINPHFAGFHLHR